MLSTKYNRTYHFPFSPGTTSDDRILHDWQTMLEHEIVITEKLDGENNCLKSSGVYARSHAAPTRNPWAKNAWEIWERVKDELGDLEVFGENLYGIHSIEYNNLHDYFHIFAIRDEGTFLSWDEVVFYAKLLDLPTVPVYERGHFTEKELEKSILEGLKAGSQHGGECEGFVCRNVGQFDTEDFKYNVIKYVRANHVKTDEHWTRNWKRAKLWFEFATS